MQPKRSGTQRTLTSVPSRALDELPKVCADDSRTATIGNEPTSVLAGSRNTFWVKPVVIRNWLLETPPTAANWSVPRSSTKADTSTPQSMSESIQQPAVSRTPDCSPKSAERRSEEHTSELQSLRHL